MAAVTIVDKMTSSSPYVFVFYNFGLTFAVAVWARWSASLYTKSSARWHRLGDRGVTESRLECMHARLVDICQSARSNAQSPAPVCIESATWVVVLVVRWFAILQKEYLDEYQDESSARLFALWLQSTTFGMRTKSLIYRRWHRRHCTILYPLESRIFLLYIVKRRRCCATAFSQCFFDILSIYTFSFQQLLTEKLLVFVIYSGQNGPK